MALGECAETFLPGICVIESPVPENFLPCGPDATMSGSGIPVRRASLDRSGGVRRANAPSSIRRRSRACATGVRSNCPRAGRRAGSHRVRGCGCQPVCSPRDRVPHPHHGARVFGDRTGHECRRALRPRPWPGSAGASGVGGAAGGRGPRPRSPSGRFGAMYAGTSRADAAPRPSDLDSGFPLGTRAPPHQGSRQSGYVR